MCRSWIFTTDALSHYLCNFPQRKTTIVRFSTFLCKSCVSSHHRQASHSLLSVSLLWQRTQWDKTSPFPSTSNIILITIIFTTLYKWQHHLRCKITGNTWKQRTSNESKCNFEKTKSSSKHHPPHDQVHHRNCGLLGLLGTSLLGHLGSRADGLDWCEVFCYSSGNYDHIDHYEDDDHHPHEDHHVKVCLHVAFVHAAVNPLLFLMLQVAVILIIFDYIQLLELVCTHKSYHPPAPRAVYGTQCWILSAVAFVRRQPDHIYQRRGYFFLSILCFIM